MYQKPKSFINISFKRALTLQAEASAHCVRLSEAPKAADLQLLHPKLAEVNIHAIDVGVYDLYSFYVEMCTNIII